MKFKYRILLLVAVPYIAYIFSSFASITTDWKNYKLVSEIESNTYIVSTASALINELQKERGKSATFLNGGADLNFVLDQRKIVDQKAPIFLEKLNSSNLNANAKEEVLSNIKNLNKVRTSVNSKAKLPEVLKAYTKIVYSLLNLEKYIAGISQFDGLDSLIRTVPILEEAKENSGKLRANLSGILAKNKALSDKKLQTIVSLKAGMDANLKSPGLILNNSQIKTIKNFENNSHWIEVNKTFELVLKNANKGNYNKNAKEFFSVITKSVNDIGSLVKSQIDIVQLKANNLKKEIKTALYTRIIFNLLLAIGIIFLCIYMIRAITKPINKIISLLKENSAQVTSAAHQVASSGEILAQCATEQAATLEDTVSSLEKVANMADSNSESSKNANELTSKVDKKCEESTTSMNEMCKQISAIETAANETAEIIRVIDDIAFQTNLLALNAAVEAARAGDAGKGFAVVAEEVRNLAQRSAESAKNTESKINKSLQLASEGVKATEITANSILEIREFIAQSSSLVKQISEDSYEQSSGVKNLNSSVLELDQVTHSNAASAEESAAASQELLAQSKNLDSVVSDLHSIFNGK